MAVGQARERLLTAAMDYLGTRGISDLSLRQLADALGTSHRMLIYHFGSKEGLLTEVVRRVEQAQQELWEQLREDPDSTTLERARVLWRRSTDESMEPYARLFFELYGQALQGREPATALLDRDIESWQRLNVRDLRQWGYSEPRAEVVSRLGIAVVRGLLLDLLATGEREPTTEAFELFLEWAQHGAGQ